MFRETLTGEAVLLHPLHVQIHHARARRRVESDGLAVRVLEPRGVERVRRVLGQVRKQVELHVARRGRVVAVDGPIALTDCTVEEDGACNIEALCPTKTNWRKINNAVVKALEDVTLADMMPEMVSILPHRPFEPAPQQSEQGGKIG